MVWCCSAMQKPEEIARDRWSCPVIVCLTPVPGQQAGWLLFLPMFVFPQTIQV